MLVVLHAPPTAAQSQPTASTARTSAPPSRILPSSGCVRSRYAAPAGGSTWGRPSARHRCGGGLVGHEAAPGARTTTVSMTVQYVGGAKGSDLICEARTVRRRRELVSTEVTATDTDGAVIAHAIQTYRIA